MKRFRASILTGFIACGLLCLNLGGFVFSFTAEIPAASYAAAPVDGDDTDDASDVVTAAVPSARREAIVAALRQEHASLVTRYSSPPLVPGHVALTWHFAQRAAASPRAPSVLA